MKQFAVNTRKWTIAHKRAFAGESRAAITRARSRVVVSLVAIAGGDRAENFATELCLPR